MGSVQRRQGPVVVGFFGLGQPIADGLKLILKEVILPSKSNFFLFILAPSIILVLSFLNWVIIPFGLFNVIANVNLGILFILSLSSLNVYGIIFAGWASNSKYAFLGALRSTAQMISYEISIGLIILPIIFCVGSLNFIDIVLYQYYTVWFIIPFFPLCILFFISILAETNRSPFDLAEAEAELVAGFNVEYSSMTFALFFVGEYCNMILMSIVLVLLFLGG